MQTKQQIQTLLSQNATGPKRRLGQHFLIDLNLMRMIVDSAGLTAQDVVLEVGCGTGSLTEGLAEVAGRVVAVEVDDTVIDLARQQLADQDHVTILHMDILKNKHTLTPQVQETLDGACHQYPGRFLLVANLPYHVGSPVMINLVLGQRPVDAMVVTVQKEVGQRMVAGAGSKHYGTLGILLQATGSVEILRILKPSVFWPQPQVDSAMLRYVRNPEKVAAIHDMQCLMDIIDLFIGHRRKMLKACVKQARNRLAKISSWDKIFERCHLDPTLRPEQIPPEGFVQLANTLTKQR